MSRDVVVTDIDINTTDDWKPAEEVYELYNTSLPSRSGELGGAIVRVLSVDPETGATTTILKVPAGWQTPPSREKHSVLQEEFILSGELSFGGIDLKPPAYISMPAGTWHGPAIAKTDCVLISICYGPLDVTFEEA